MMEKFESNIERNWKKFYMQIGDKALEMCQSNTDLFKHHEDYSDYDLIQTQNEDGKALLFLKDHIPQLYEALKEEGFNEHYQEYPHISHEEHVFKYWNKETELEAELIANEEE